MNEKTACRMIATLFAVSALVFGTVSVLWWEDRDSDLTMFYAVLLGGEAVVLWRWWLRP